VALSPPGPSEWDATVDPDPSRALPAIAALQGLLRQREEDAVRRAREQGLAWEEIARLLGRVRSSVWERYHNKEQARRPPT
jgi:DNA-directed RNA polymerase specialized sigma24 family protein